jgi:hypothetical protein
VAVGRQNDTIGGWTPQQLTKYLQAALREDEILSATVKTFDEVFVNRLITVIDEIKFSQAQATVGAAGGASALPATPKGYFKVLDPTGAVVLVPYYATS